LKDEFVDCEGVEFTGLKNGQPRAWCDWQAGPAAPRGTPRRSRERPDDL